MQAQIEQFLEHLVTVRQSTVNTTVAYQNDLNQFLTFLQENDEPGRPLEEWSQLDGPTLTRYLEHLKNQDYASATVARKVASVKGFLQYLFKQRLIPADLSKHLISPKVKKNLPRLLEPEDIEKLLAAPTAQRRSPKTLRDKALLELLYATGMRVSELVSLDVDSVDLAEGTVTCGENGRRIRTVPIYPGAVQALEQYLEEGRIHLLINSDEPALFLNMRGQRLTRQGLWLIIKHYVKAVGIADTVTPHSLRHSFAAHLLNAGVELSEVQARLGHASPTTTQVYRQLSGENGHQLIVDGQVVPIPTQAETPATSKPEISPQSPGD